MQDHIESKRPAQQGHMEKAEKTQMIHINMENTVSADTIAAFRQRRFKVVAQNLVQDVEPFPGLLIRPALLVLILNFLLVLFVPVLLRDMIHFGFCQLRIYLAKDFYVASSRTLSELPL